MKYLKSGSVEEEPLRGDEDCVVNSTSSWYIDCQGKSINFLPTKQFTIIDKEELKVQIKLYKIAVLS